MNSFPVFPTTFLCFLLFLTSSSDLSTSQLPFPPRQQQQQRPSPPWSLSRQVIDRRTLSGFHVHFRPRLALSSPGSLSLLQRQGPSLHLASSFRRRKTQTSHSNAALVAGRPRERGSSCLPAALFIIASRSLQELNPVRHGARLAVSFYKQNDPRELAPQLAQLVQRLCSPTTSGGDSSRRKPPFVKPRSSHTSTSLTH